jgi:hypothetical protein
MQIRSLAVVGLTVLLVACTAEPGSERWCKQKKEQAKSEWSMEDAKTFAAHCLIEDFTIGSKDWCENLNDKPKGDWTADEAASYAKHCVM